MAASSKSASVPNIYLSVERMTKMKMRKSRGKDIKLNICKLSDFKLHQVRSVLEIIPPALLNKGDTKPIILYAGCSRIDTEFINNFMEGDLVSIRHTHLMDGIGASLGETHELNLHY